MKRQGRQHGMVRAYPMMMPGQRSPIELRSPAVSGIFAKVSSKPTNHSKFTGKCGRARCIGCHIHPASKSKGKAKGTQKMRSPSDVVSNYRLITWRVVDSAPGFKISGFSATALMDYLEYTNDYDYDYNYESENSEHEHDSDHDRSHDGSYDHEIEEIDGSDDADYDDDDDRMSFCEVGFVWEAVDGDESWCLVDEI